MKSQSFLTLLIMGVFLVVSSHRVLAQDDINVTETTNETILNIEVSPDDVCPSDYLILNETTQECECIEGYTTAREDGGVTTCTKSTTALGEVAANAEALEVFATTDGSLNAVVSGATCTLSPLSKTTTSLPALYFLCLSFLGILSVRFFQHQLREVSMKKITMTLLILALTTTACREDNNLTGVAATTTAVPAENSSAASEAASYSTINTEIVKIYPSCTVESCSKAEILKSLPSGMTMGAVLNFNELANTKIMQTFFELIPNLQIFYDALMESTDGLLVNVGLTHDSIEHLAIAMDLSEVDNSPKPIIVLRPKAALTSETLIAFATQLTSAAIVVAYPSMNDEPSGGNFSMTFVSSTESQVAFILAGAETDGIEQFHVQCVLRTQALSCAVDDVYEKMAAVIADESQSAYGQLGDIFESCSSLQVFVDPSLLKTQIESATASNPTLQAALLGLVDNGMAVVTFTGEEEALVSDPNTTVGYGSLSLKYYVNSDWKTRLTLDVTDSLVDTFKTVITESME